MTAFITRDISETSEFDLRLKAAGWMVHGRSLVELSPLPFAEVPRADWIFFSSGNAVRFFFEQLKPEQKTELARVQWAALGPSTAKILAEYIGKVDFVGTGEPEETARRFGPSSGPDLLFPAARNSRQSVLALLAERFRCTHFEVYGNRLLADPPYFDAEVLVFTSPMNAQAYFSKHVLAEKQRVVAIGQTTAGALRELGIATVEVAASPDERGLAEAVLRLRW